MVRTLWAWLRRLNPWGRICFAWKMRNVPLGQWEGDRPQPQRRPMPDSDKVILVVLVFACWPAAYLWYHYRRAELDRQSEGG